MKTLPNIRVWLVTMFVALAAFVLPLQAEDAATNTTPWQDAITSQIQAFRDHDAPTAFSYAGIGFQATFPNAETFFVAILQSGYGPIMESRSHSFGKFRLLGEMGVVQQVRFVGSDQLLYEAVYQLTEESNGWRVQAVHLMQPKGVAI